MTVTTTDTAASPGAIIIGWVVTGIGMLMLAFVYQGAAYKADEAYPLDVLGVETEGMIGYMIEQELGNLRSWRMASTMSLDAVNGRISATLTLTYRRASVSWCKVSDGRASTTDARLFPSI